MTGKAIHGRGRLRAPELSGRGGWLNTGGRTLALADLRGRFVLVDFWCGCCINCLHALDELRPVEERFADSLTVVAVHSPKFPHEREHATVVAATERYGVTHPVLDDPDLRTWDAYVARAWPTLVLVDPLGYIVAEYAGEGHAHAVAALLDDLLPEYDAGGSLRRGPSPAHVIDTRPVGLRFPGGAVGLRNGHVLVADTARHCLVELAADLVTEIARIGDGTRGLADGGPGTARFAEPQKLCLLPAGVAAAAGYDVMVADTANHALRGVRLADGSVRTLAGAGAGAGAGGPRLPGDRDDVLSSPWDVEWWRGRVWVALAGTHQLATFDPGTGDCRRVAGTGAEGLRDGELSQAWFAQPSGLAADTVRDRLWLVDAETSAVRFVGGVTEESGALTVTTVAGTGLFDFGHRDGALADALFQHPLGIAVEPGGAILVADTYNGAVRRLDPDAATVCTLASELVEPSDLAFVGGRLIVAESAGHRLSVVDRGAAPALIDNERPAAVRQPTPIPAGALRLHVDFTPPPGQQLDERHGDAAQLVVVATPPELIRHGGGTGSELVRELEIDANAGDGILHVSARAASCDILDGSPNPACHIHQQDWGIPVVIAADAPAVLDLVLGGGR